MCLIFCCCFSRCIYSTRVYSSAKNKKQFPFFSHNRLASLPWPSFRSHIVPWKKTKRNKTTTKIKPKKLHRTHLFTFSFASSLLAHELFPCCQFCKESRFHFSTPPPHLFWQHFMKQLTRDAIRPHLHSKPLALVKDDSDASVTGEQADVLHFHLLRLCWQLSRFATMY